MKKNLFIFIFLLCTGSVFAQKVKVSNGIIYIDDISAARIQTISKKEGAREYRISSLNENNLIQVKELPADKIATDIWYTLTFNDGKQGAMKFDVSSLTLSNEKVLAELLVQRHKLITKSGLDEAKVDAFVAKSNADKQAALDKQNAEIAKAQKVEKMNIWVKNDGTITTNNDVVIGYAEAPNNQQLKIDDIKFFDANKKFVAKGNVLMQEGKFMTNDGREHKLTVKGNTTTSQEKSLFLTILVKQLAVLGYY